MVKSARSPSTTGGELGPDEQDAGPRVGDHVDDLRRGEPEVHHRVRRADLRARQRELHRGGVVEVEHGDAVARRDPGRAQRRGEPLHAPDQRRPRGVGAREADRHRVRAFRRAGLDDRGEVRGLLWRASRCRIVAVRVPPGRVRGRCPGATLSSPSRRSLSACADCSGDPMTTPLPPTSNMRASLRRAKAGGERFLGGDDGGRHLAQAPGQGVRRRMGRGQHRRAARRRAALGRARRFHQPGDRGHHARGGLRRRRARGAAPPRRLARDQPVAGGRGRRRRAGPPAARARRAHRRGARRARHVHRRRGGRRAPPARAPTSRCARCAPPCRAAR